MSEKSVYNGFRLSLSGQARQVVLMCHGGWTPHGDEELVGDGYTFVPKELRLHFYTEHTVTSSGAKAAVAIFNNAADAYDGLKEKYVAPEPSPGMSEAESEMNGGCQYQVFHYVPCRYTQPGHWFSDLSH